jgi:hypothetical protein
VLKPLNLYVMISWGTTMANPVLAAIGATGGRLGGPGGGEGYGTVKEKVASYALGSEIVKERSPYSQVPPVQPKPYWEYRVNVHVEPVTRGGAVTVCGITPLGTE